MRIRLSDDVWTVVIIIALALAVLGVVVWVVGRIRGAQRRTSGLEADPAFPVDGPEARDLAIGLLTITDNVGNWNDPDARRLASSPGLVKTLRKQWGIDDAEDWRANIQRLVTERRASEPRDSLLAIRWDEAQRLGTHPNWKQWKDAVTRVGGSTRGENGEVLMALGNNEERMQKYARGAVLPADATIRDVAAFAYSQAVALAVWGVAMGVATRDEALEVARQVSARARAEYGSWQEFGRSVLLGRAMFLGRNRYKDKAGFDRIMSSALENYVLATSSSSERPGPWTYLAW